MDSVSNMMAAFMFNLYYQLYYQHNLYYIVQNALKAHSRKGTAMIHVRLVLSTVSLTCQLSVCGGEVQGDNRVSITALCL